ncbi:hypothetical protein HK100_002166, partial [Physocladia obscura]
MPIMLILALTTNLISEFYPLSQLATSIYYVDVAVYALTLIGIDLTLVLSFVKYLRGTVIDGDHTRKELALISQYGIGASMAMIVSYANFYAAI